MFVYIYILGSINKQTFHWGPVSHLSVVIPHLGRFLGQIWWGAHVSTETIWIALNIDYIYMIISHISPAILSYIVVFMYSTNIKLIKMIHLINYSYIYQGSQLCFLDHRMRPKKPSASVSMASGCGNLRMTSLWPPWRGIIPKWPNKITLVQFHNSLRIILNLR